MTRCTVPVDFLNSHYCFTNPPPFIGDPQGPTFSLRKPESASVYTYFSLLFDDDQMIHIADQMNLYTRLDFVCQANYQWFDTRMSMRPG